MHTFETNSISLDMTGFRVMRTIQTIQNFFPIKLMCITAMCAAKIKVA
jgi:hypothetical protein